MSATRETFLAKYCPSSFQDLVKPKDRDFSAIEDFLETPYLSHWLLHGNLGLGKSTTAFLMAQRVAGNTDHGSARSLSGNEINAGVLKEIQITAQYLPRGLFHVVVVDEADTIPGFFRTSLLKMTDPKDLNAPRNTIWIFTSNEEPEKALGEKLSSRVNRVRFSSQGIAEPAARWLMKIASLEGFNLPEAAAKNLVKETQNNLREALILLQRKCVKGKLARIDAESFAMQEAA
jgi:DNA polymerase III delta prime subunit